MIILYHDAFHAINYEDSETNTILSCSETNIQKCLYSLSQKYTNTLLIWCHHTLKDFINKKNLEIIFHHQLILASYSINGEFVISKEIGFVDQHCFINVKNDVKYPTWLMSSDIGGINSNVILKSKPLININQSFDEFLCSLAKLNMPKGLLCYSEPKLFLKLPENLLLTRKNNNSTLFKFVKRHYKIQWVFILLLNKFIYNRQFPFAAFIKSFFVKRINFSSDFTDLILKSTKETIAIQNFNVDVLIPTLGRKEHLHNVLKDLSKQTILPQKVIIVEQNGDENSVSDLDYLNNDWPFKIDHTFIHQLGACNARNIALSKVTGNWVFFADDDVRFKVGLLEKTLVEINKYGAKSIVLGCLQKGEINKNEIIKQSEHFGAGTSVVKASFLKNIKFKKEHEFGYGEDNDFGMQLRGVGVEIISVPKINMLHLKAPVGGFRSKYKPLWNNDEIQPKPSPTVMAYNLKHLTKEQLCGYKTLLYTKYYTKQTIKNPIHYIIRMKKQWNVSVSWAKIMMNNGI
jgi:glycosyltransferase involved in cell wall biosynthesis